MSLLTVHRSEFSDEFASQIKGTNSLLLRIAEALERLAPPLDAQPAPVPATLSDLRRTDLQSLARIQSELDHYAKENAVALNSEAFLKSIYEYEMKVIETYGSDAINELPWNKAAGGPLFQSYPDYEAGRARRKNQATSQQSPQGAPSKERTGR